MTVHIGRLNSQNAAVSANVPEITREEDRSSEPFIKPKFSAAVVDHIKWIGMCLKGTFQRVFTWSSTAPDKHRGWEDFYGHTNKNLKNDSYTVHHTVMDLIRPLLGVTVKVAGIFLPLSILDELSLDECIGFISKWMKELMKVRNKHTLENFRPYPEDLNITSHGQTLQDAQREFQWLIDVVQHLPEKSVCDGGDETLDLYRQWKSGRLVSILPVLDAVMTDALDSVDKHWLQLEWGDTERGRKSHSSPELRGNWRPQRHRLPHTLVELTAWISARL